jgi:hypothetical protein
LSIVVMASTLAGPLGMLLSSGAAISSDAAGVGMLLSSGVAVASVFWSLMG